MKGELRAASAIELTMEKDWSWLEKVKAILTMITIKPTVPKSRRGFVRMTRRGDALTTEEESTHPRAWTSACSYP